MSKKMPLGAKINKFPPYLFKELDKKRSEAEKKGRNIISLAVGDPDIATPVPIARFAAKEVLKKSNHSYPYSKGNAKLRNSIAAWHKRRYGTKLDPNSEVLALIGSKEGIAHLPFIVLNKGDTAIIPNPAYPAYKTGVLLSDAKAVGVPLKEENGFLPDLDAIDKKLLKKTKLFFLNYPNNPTGAAADKKFYTKIIKLAKKYSFWLAQDAAYSEIYFNKPPLSIFEIPGAKAVAVEFHSISKTFCMTGWRMAWVIGNKDIIRELGKLKENMDSGQFNAVQLSAAYALDNYEKFVPPLRKVFYERRKKFVAALKESGWSVCPSGASFFVWARPPVKMSSIKCVYKMLEASDVLATPGSGFGSAGEGYVRFSLTVDDSLLAKAARKIKKIKW
ncbi:MAG: aminotransferase class I/II-fold pyridoxal phosphate-dependent enzyme [Elusimicrobiales bacterium]|nr:aminotransferase class I/II-fold pyridoxal phosphate-dependent enzyme [Elusimicrobiales bacterium]